MAWTRGMALGCLFAILLAAPISAGTAVLRPGYTDGEAIGPQRAVGAVIWSHGRGTTAPMKADMLPFYLDALRQAGWDVFRLDRDWASDSLQSGAARLTEQAGRLTSQGYRRVVLAGQSFGAWQSLMAAAGGASVHAVLAAAPAAFGKYPESVVYQRNATDLLPVLSRIRDVRVMMFLFDDDPFDPGGRGQAAQGVFDQNGVDHLVLDRPAGWLGHGAANWRGFARRFGDCISRFVDPSRRGAAADCTTDPVSVADLPLASALQPVASKDRVSLVGTWYGVYPNGREAMLAVERVEGDLVRAEYIWGGRERGDPDGGLSRRSGRVQSDLAVFDEPGQARLVARLRPSGALDLTWTGSDGSETIRAELRRLQ